MAFRPCQECAWTVAAETSALEAEIRLLQPAPGDVGALSRLLPDPMIAARACRAILDHGGRDPDHPATIALLAAAASHAPALLIPEGCAEGDCELSPAACRGPGGTVACASPAIQAGCPACSVQAGAWAGEREGAVLTECTVRAPCPVLLALAAIGSSRS